MYRILIIEDDRTIANVLAEHLRTWDYEVHCVTNFKNVMEDFREYEPQLVLLDIVLPLFNGFHWCQEIRKISKVPIIFLSSANDNMNIVMAMNMGGDEFVEKPFDLSVVMAKVQAVLRRAYAFRGTMDVLEHAGVMLNVNDATVTCGSQSVELTKNEFRILKLLMENSFSRVKIISPSGIPCYRCLFTFSASVYITWFIYKMIKYLYFFI